MVVGVEGQVGVRAVGFHRGNELRETAAVVGAAQSVLVPCACMGTRQPGD